jgi:UV DNA damage endonuclease
MSTAPATHPQHLGLVCVTHSDECRFRTITRTRFLTLGPEQQRDTLRALYQDNLARLTATLAFCDRHDIRLYRATSGLFPMSDDAVGTEVLHELSASLAEVGPLAKRLGIRVVLHPDQFVVLNSDTTSVIDTSIRILEKHALAFDLMGLPRTPWSAFNIHGGKAGRSDRLVDVIRTRLPANVRDRLTLENDEYSFSAADILDVCRRAGVPMVFDCHHHVIKEKLDSYEHPSVAAMVKAARATWPDPAWQVVHLSNGKDGFLDRQHSEFISAVPSS